MRKITAIKAQQKTNERVNLYLDGEFAFGLAVEAAAGLRVGQTLDEAAIAALQDEDLFFKAKWAAQRLLSYRPRSVAEVRRRLQRKDYPDETIERVIAHLEMVKLLDDQAFTAYWIEQRETFKPRSRLALRQELYRKGVARPVVEKMLAGVDDEALARRAAAKRAYRWADLPHDSFVQKMGGFLQRRGFHYETVRLVVEESWAALHENETLC